MLTLLAGVELAAQNEAAREAYLAHRWFELRDAVAADPSVAPLYKGAAASAFNRPRESERWLKPVIRSSHEQEDIDAAREKLATLYLRQGRMREAIANLRAILASDAKPRPDIQNVADLFAPLSASPNMSARLPDSGSTLSCEVVDDGIWVSPSVNGKRVTWLLDTGFNFSGASESEAKALGISVLTTTATVSDIAGGTAKAKVGLARKIRFGAIELRNVPFLIFPDSQQPFADWPQGKRGVIGLQTALALESLSWTRDSKCRAGFPVAPDQRKGAADLAIDDFNPIVRGQLNGKPLDFVFDSGNQAGTQLWTRFQTDFEALTHGEGVTKGTERITQIGGGNDRPVTKLPGLKFQLGGFALDLKPVKIFSLPVGDKWHHGLLGMDLLRLAREVTLDFRSMTVVLK